MPHVGFRLTRRAFQCFTVALVATLASSILRAQAPVVELRNGEWFTGAGFARGSRWMANGRFVRRPSRSADSAVDLHGQWVIPPFGDAHTHSPDGVYGFDAIRDLYLRLGVFYVQTLSNHVSGRVALTGKVNVPTSIDVAFADAAVTSSGGHPQVLYESLALYRTMVAPGSDSGRVARRSVTQDGDVYFRVDSASQLDSIARRIARDSAAPILKLILVNSDRYDEIGRDTTLAELRGLRAEFVAPLVAAAHRAGRRVWVHVESAADFGVALAAGVDGFAHVPGYGTVFAEGEPNMQRHTLPDSLIQLAGRRHLLMTATLGLSRTAVAKDTAAARRFREVAVFNAARLRRAGVRLLSGSDTYASADAIRDDPLETAMALGLSPLDVLRMRAVETPQAIFPGRRIGVLQRGYDASALVLTCNPLQDTACGERIAMRLKAGHWLAAPSTP